MEVKSYYPGQHKRWNRKPDGSVAAELYTHHGVVKVFTFPGDDQHEAFTSLEIYIAPQVYHARLSRYYHERWLMRIANDFGWQAGKLADQQGRS